MSDSIRDFVMRHPLFDTHAHVMTMPAFAETAGHYADIVGYAAADQVTAAGPLRPGQRALPPTDDPGHKAAFFALWRKCRATGYCRPIERACLDLLGVPYAEESADAVSDALKRLKGADPSAAYVDILCRAGIKEAIRDHVFQPQDMRDGLYPPFVRFNYRDDLLLTARSRADIMERERRWNRSIHTLDQLVHGFMQSISDCLATGKITSFKIGVAYRRGLDFGEASRHDAETAFNRLVAVEPGTVIDLDSCPASRRSSDELRPMHDYLTHVFVRRATDEDLPIQVHTGYLAGNYRVLNNINPMQLVPLLLRYPQTRFDLFHAGWPYHHEAGVIGKHFPNVWLNLCWAWTMNPVTMGEALDAWLDATPHNKIFAFGSDTSHPLCVYAYAMQARDGVARVLQRRMDRGDMDAALAREVAAAILFDNAAQFHRV